MVADATVEVVDIAVETFDKPLAVPLLSPKIVPGLLYGPPVKLL